MTMTGDNQSVNVGPPSLRGSRTEGCDEGSHEAPQVRLGPLGSHAQALEEIERREPVREAVHAHRVVQRRRFPEEAQLDALARDVRQIANASSTAVCSAGERRSSPRGRVITRKRGSCSMANMPYATPMRSSALLDAGARDAGDGGPHPLAELDVTLRRDGLQHGVLVGEVAVGGRVADTDAPGDLPRVKASAPFSAISTIDASTRARSRSPWW